VESETNKSEAASHQQPKMLASIVVASLFVVAAAQAGDTNGTTTSAAASVGASDSGLRCIQSIMVDNVVELATEEIACVGKCAFLRVDCKTGDEACRTSWWGKRVTSALCVQQSACDDFSNAYYLKGSRCCETNNCNDPATQVLTAGAARESASVLGALAVAAASMLMLMP
jgi:hypothetical protein